MDSKQQLHLLFMLKALADYDCLKIVSLVGEQEQTVAKMVKITGLSVANVSRYVSRLHTAGILRLRVFGGQRFYSINQEQLHILKMFIIELSEPIASSQVFVSQNRWISDLDFSDEDKMVLYEYTFNGRLIDLPDEEEKLLVILNWIATKFETGILYTQKKINITIRKIYPKYATIRHSLIEYGFICRERGGTNYWLAPKA